MKIFCYGTLMRGHYNNRLLQGQTFVKVGVTKPCYRLFSNGSYPMLVKDPENGYSVTGEIWEVDEKCIQDMDCLEGAPFMYKREIIQFDEAENVEGYIYQRSISGRKELCNGVWERNL